MMDGVFLLVGTNLGNKKDNLKLAFKNLIANQIRIVKSSYIYETEPWGMAHQPVFYNQVIQVETDYAPEKLLYILKDIEKLMGRAFVGKWEERIIDLDILYYNNLVIESEKLTVPHPQIAFRRFALAPLAEIAPDFYHPVLQKKQSELLESCPDKLEVKIVDV